MNEIALARPTFASGDPRWLPGREGLRRIGIFFLGSAICCLAGAYYLYLGEHAPQSDQIASLIVFIAASIASIAGFAFSALAGALLFHFVPDTVHAVQIMLVASISLQAYSVWKLRNSISVSALAPYLAGGSLMVVPGVWLLLHTPAHLYMIALGVFLIGYGLYMLLRRPLRLQNNYLLGRLVVGALGGITGATAAFPGAFVTIWCGAHGWDKEKQRAIYQPYILAMQLLTLGALGASPSAGATLNPELMLYVVPAVAGAGIGLRMFERLSTSQFNRVVSIFLLLSGVVLSCKVV
jgi:uncharacterized membrane protein YfcA